MSTTMSGNMSNQCLAGYHATLVPVPRWVRLIFLRQGVRLFGFSDHRTKALLDPAAIIGSTAGVAAVSKKVSEMTSEPSPQLQSSPFIIRRPPSKRRTSLAVSVNEFRRTSDSAADPTKSPQTPPRYHRPHQGISDPTKASQTPPRHIRPHQGA